MKELNNTYEVFSSKSGLETRLLEEGFEVTDSGEGVLQVSSFDVHSLQLAVSSEEIVIDYVESSSLEPGAGSNIVEILKDAAKEGGKVVRASGVLPEAVDFWTAQGFIKDGTDYIYES